ncbi:hypothetical protein DRE_07329 [Drechslerella stenobrocha 248]|uniref:N-alpha-acetyltransferase 40 n=1 Tax=Drechslerella stenobrocha 248 TaxID=1043628 RepID=W7I4Z7_9PEZI|nr:hypothetical protein DRE_07329 [Drechslerella stenobrocha 248]
MSAQAASSGHATVSADGTTKKPASRRKPAVASTPPPPTLIERTNALHLEDLKSRFLDGSLLAFAGPSDNASTSSYHIELYTSSSLPEATFNDCFDLLEANMSTSYRITSIGWHPRKKKEEMKHPAMRYLILTAVAGGSSDDINPAAEKAREGTAVGSMFIGFLEFMITEEEGAEVIYTYELDLVPSHQKLGLGKKLLDVAEEFGKRVGVEKAMLTVFDSNKGARRFYEREGYDIDEISPDPKTLRNGLVKPPTFHILSKSFIPPTND